MRVLPGHALREMIVADFGSRRHALCTLQRQFFFLVRLFEGRFSVSGLIETQCAGFVSHFHAALQKNRQNPHCNRLAKVKSSA
jgi:hypothetical protein